MKESFDDLKIVTGDTVLQLPTKGTILTESSPTIDVESIVSENDPVSKCFKAWADCFNKTAESGSVKHSSTVYIHYPAVYKHRKLVKRPGAGQRRATVFCIKSKTRVLQNVIPVGINSLQLIDHPKMMNVTLEMHFSGEDVNG